jgi:hypothetical protein
MKSVKLNVALLLSIVKQNREQHVSAYNESVADYKAAVIKLMKQNLKLAQSNDLAQIAQIKSIPPVPTSHQREYDHAIRMLELCVDTDIVLEQADFNQLVMDEWHWKQSFISSTALYKTLA